MSVRKGVSLHLRSPFVDALRLLKAKYGASATQVVESLLERDLLENEPEIAAEVGLERRAPNRFAGGGLPWNMSAAPSVHSLRPGDVVEVASPHVPITSAWGNESVIYPPAEVPPSQRVRS